MAAVTLTDAVLRDAGTSTSAVRPRVDDRVLDRPAATPAETALLQVDGVTLEYATHDSVVRATHRVSFDVHRADRFVLLGPSGCGKSSLLKAIGGFIAPRDIAFVDARAVINSPPRSAGRRRSSPSPKPACS